MATGDSRCRNNTFLGRSPFGRLNAMVSVLAATYLTLAPAPIDATPLTIQGEVFTSASTSSGIQNDRQFVNAGQASGTLTQSKSASSSGSVTPPPGPTFSTDATANISGTVTFGILKGNASAVASAIPFSPFYELQASAAATESVVFHDFFTPTGLQSGDQALYRFTLALDSNVTADGGCFGNGGGSAGVTLSDFIGNTLRNNSFDACGADGVQISSTIGSFIVGASYDIWADMELSAGANADTNLGPLLGTGTADALDTGLLTIESLTPGASYMTASGTVYSGSSSGSSVPEPSTLPLLLAGFAGLGICGYRGQTTGRWLIFPQRSSANLA